MHEPSITPSSTARESILFGAIAKDEATIFFSIMQENETLNNSSIKLLIGGTHVSSPDDPGIGKKKGSESFLKSTFHSEYTLFTIKLGHRFYFEMQ